MNRRSFLQGCAAAVATGLPTSALASAEHSPADAYRAWVAEWLRDVAPALGAMQADFMTFGTGAVRYTAEYPYLVHVPPSDIFSGAAVDWRSSHEAPGYDELYGDLLNISETEGGTSGISQS